MSRQAALKHANTSSFSGGVKLRLAKPDLSFGRAKSVSLGSRDVPSMRLMLKIKQKRARAAINLVSMNSF